MYRNYNSLIANKQILNKVKLISQFDNSNDFWWKAYLLDVDIFNDEVLYEEVFNSLPDFRKDDAAKFKFKKDRNLSVGAWVALAYAMTQNGFADCDVKFNINENGKPYISNECKNHCFFNLSHSGHYALCAISNREIGCDIQKHDAIKDSFVQFCMNNKELKSFKDTKYDNWCKAAFYRLWTLKESYMKMTSLGMQINPKDIQFLVINKNTQDYKFDILCDKNKNSNILKQANFFELDAPQNYSISLCAGWSINKVL